MCLSHAPEVVRKSTQIVEVRSITKKIKGIEKQVVHYELAHVVKVKEDLRVIVERIGAGKYKFLSIMPKGKRNKKRPTGRS